MNQVRLKPIRHRPPFTLALILLASSLTLMSDLEAQPAGYNYDETQVPPYTLPDPLLLADGTKIDTAEAWRSRGRPATLELFRQHVYGRSPAPTGDLSFEVTARQPQALGGKANRKEITVYFTKDKQGPKMSILLYVPAQATSPVPAFLGLNFGGNHAIHTDPGITLSPQWGRSAKDPAAALTLPAAETRGKEGSRWPVELIVERGYALATIFYGDIEPDFAGGWRHGLRNTLGRDFPGATSATTSQPAVAGPEENPGGPAGAPPDHWGAIGAWAWGLSRALDYLEKDPDINAKQVAVIGHSRLGKTSLWAGAQDERFALVISNDSGCGGAALSRRLFGETVERINTSFPHWFCGRHKKYNGKESECPVDQHQLLALIAPRPVYVASAQEDLWADPRGEFLAALHAEPVYKLLGRAGLETTDWPPVNQPVGQFIGYHVRTGKHDVTRYDWERYLDFADKHLRHAAVPSNSGKAADSK